MQPWTAASSTSDDPKSKCCGLANAKRVKKDNVAKRRLQTSRHSRRINKGVGEIGGKGREGGWRGSALFLLSPPFLFPDFPNPSLCACYIGNCGQTKTAPQKIHGQAILYVLPYCMFLNLLVLAIS